MGLVWDCGTDRCVYCNDEKNEKFAHVIYKIDEADGHTFKKMHVRLREQIVNLSLEDDINPNELTGQYLSPKEFYEQMQEEDSSYHRCAE